MSMALDLASALDGAAFAARCGVTPDPWQRDLLQQRPPRALLNCSRQSGKSTVCQLLALHTALYSNGLTVVASPSMRQSGEFVRECKRLFSNLKDGPGLVGNSVLRLEFESGARIVALPGSEATIRGLSNVKLLIVDEASRVPDDLIAALKPMLAVSNGSLVALSTPAGKRGFFYTYWTNGDPAWTRISVPASACPRISKEFLAAERKELGEARYSEEYELAFIDNGTAAFSTSIIDQAFSDEVRPLW